MVDVGLISPSLSLISKQGPTDQTNITSQEMNRDDLSGNLGKTLPRKICGGSEQDLLLILFSRGGCPPDDLSEIIISGEMQIFHDSSDQ